MVMSKSGWYSGMLHVAACRALRIRLLRQVCPFAVRLKPF